jgi:hypothetical protein
MKPLCIPLKSECYAAFQRGYEGSELRRYGPRGNERICPVGRPVMVSKGDGNQNRRQARLSGVHRRNARTFGSTYRASIERLYGSLGVEIAEIRLEIFRSTVLLAGLRHGVQLGGNVRLIHRSMS